jgi:hypothetical protein
VHFVADRPAVVGWNQGKLAFARDIVDGYSRNQEVIGRVANNAEHAVLALAAYGSLDPIGVEKARELGWSSKSYINKNLIVGDTVATLFTAPGKTAVLAFRGTSGGPLKSPGDWQTNTAGVVIPLPLFNAQIEGARDIAREVVKEHPDVVFVGHSLGGRLAQAARLTTGNAAVGFNSAFLGLTEKVEELIKPKDRLEPLLLFRSPDDPLTHLASDSTTVVKNIENTDLSLAGNLFSAGYTHSMGVMATAMMNVKIAVDQGWISNYLAGVPVPAAQAPQAPTARSACPQMGQAGNGAMTTADCMAAAMSNLASAVQSLNTARLEGRISGAVGQAVSEVISQNPQAEKMQLDACRRLGASGANELSTAACLALVWSKSPEVRRDASDMFDKIIDDVNARIASNRLPLTTVPPVYVVKGGCPGEGCRFGMWTALGERPLFESPGSGRAVGHVKRGERVAALRSELRVRPVKGVVEGRIDPLKPGETVYLMDYVGNGLSNIWARGQVFADPRSEDGCSPAPMCKSAMRFPAAKAAHEWWVRVQRRDGQSGWVRADIEPWFSGMSWVETAAVALPDPYDKE